jgi:hypothetical protein
MPLTRRDRFALKSQMVDVIMEDREWTSQRTNLLLAEYGCQTIDPYDNNGEFTFADSIKDIGDADLVEMYSLVTGTEPENVQSQIDTGDSSLWKPGYVRVFLSHSAIHKQFIGQVADELAVSGIHGFVAHDTMEYEQPWQEQIEHGLRTMQAFVAIIHPEFLPSAWCQQEVGWALGRGVPRYVVRYPTDPVGFIGRTQWPQGSGMNHRQVAAEILQWVSRIPEFSDQIVVGLLAALRSAGNYMDAGATASRIATIDTLTQDQWDELVDIFHANDQVRGGSLAHKALRPLFDRHSRQFPPAKPVPF